MRIILCQNSALILLMGSFYPLVSKTMAVPSAPGPYAIAFFFVIGTVLCSLPNFLFMKKLINAGAAVDFNGMYQPQRHGISPESLAAPSGSQAPLLTLVASTVPSLGPRSLTPSDQVQLSFLRSGVSSSGGSFVRRPLASEIFSSLCLSVFIVGLASISVAPFLALGKGIP
jgi:glucose uptake protein